MAEIGFGFLLHVLNIMLVIALLYIYFQNYSKIKSRYTTGLIVFALLLFLHSAMGLYFDATMVMYSTHEAESYALLLEAVKSIALVALLKVSWD